MRSRPLLVRSTSPASAGEVKLPLMPKQCWTGYERRARCAHDVLRDANPTRRAEAKIRRPASKALPLRAVNFRGGSSRLWPPRRQGSRPGSRTGTSALQPHAGTRHRLHKAIASVQPPRSSEISWRGTLWDSSRSGGCAGELTGPAPTRRRSVQFRMQVGAGRFDGSLERLNMIILAVFT